MADKKEKKKKHGHAKSLQEIETLESGKWKGGRDRNFLPFSEAQHRWRTRGVCLRASTNEMEQKDQDSWSKDDGELYGAIFRCGQEFILRYRWTRVIGVLFLAVVILFYLISVFILCLFFQYETRQIRALLIFCVSQYRISNCQKYTASQAAQSKSQKKKN